MLFNPPHFSPGCSYLSGAESRPWGGLRGGGRPGRAGQGSQQGHGVGQAATGQQQAATGQQGAAWPTAGQQGARGGAAAGARPLSPSQDRLRRAAAGRQEQQCQQGGVGLSGPLGRRRRSAGNRKPPPGQGQGQGPQGGAVGAGISPAR